MANPAQLHENDKVFCIGAFLQPLEVEINGHKQWRWVLAGSEDSSFLDGEEVMIYDYAPTLQGLLMPGESVE
ncbi:MAG: hypothetical protein MPK09_03850 [Gammaproteobacteria bacterium]|nr:hypothetical protein [Gammaproteobacteria bacterium]